MRHVVYAAALTGEDKIVANLVLWIGGGPAAGHVGTVPGLDLSAEPGSE